MPRSKPRFKFRGLKALMSALSEGAMSLEETEQALAAVQMGIGLSKRDKALGAALEQTGEEKDGPSYWSGFRDGLVQGYAGAHAEQAAGRPLKSVAELIAEAQAEAGKEGAAN